MKKTILLSLSLFSLTLVLLLSCQKNETRVSIDDTDGGSLSVKAAQKWFETSSTPATSSMRNTSGNKANDFTPIWSRGIVNGDDKYYVVECPIRFDKPQGFSSQPASNKLDTNNMREETRLIVLKNKTSGKMLSALMHVFSMNSTGSEIRYRPQESNFTGYLFFTTLEGDFVNGWKYSNGKVVSEGHNNKSKTLVNGKGLPDDPNNCYTVITNWYQRDCVEYNNGSYQCGNWEYMYSTSQEYCPTTGGGGDGGGGGGTYEEENSEEILMAEFDDEIKDSLEHACLKDVLDHIKRIKQGKIAEIIVQFSGQIPSWNLTFTEGYANGNSAQTSPNLNNGFVNITLDYSKIGIGTDLSTARYIMHEAVHAYLVAYYINDPTSFQKDYQQLFQDYIAEKSTGVAQHEEMGRTFVNQIASALKQFGQVRGYNISDQIYHDIAWGGLYSTNSGVPAFNALTPFERERIRSRNAAENTNTTRDGEVPVGIKKCN